MASKALDILGLELFNPQTCVELLLSLVMSRSETHFGLSAKKTLIWAKNKTPASTSTWPSSNNSPAP